MEEKQCGVNMQLWIDDAYKYEIVSAILREEREFVLEVLKQNDYWHQQDRLDDEDYLRAINVILKNYEVQDGTEH